MDDYWGWTLLVVALVLGAAVYVWEHGLLGTATEARLKHLRDEAKAEWEKFEARLAEIVAAREKKEAEEAAATKAAEEAASEEAEATQLVEKDKATRIAENKALLDAGIITQAEFQAAKEKILVD